MFKRATLILAASLAAPLAFAKTPAASSEAAGATTGLGSSHRFATAAAAAAHCTSDVVVWASRKAATYVTPGSPNYGKSGGFYACKAEADGAGFSAAN